MEDGKYRTQTKRERHQQTYKAAYSSVSKYISKVYTGNKSANKRFIWMKIDSDKEPISGRENCILSVIYNGSETNGKHFHNMVKQKKVLRTPQYHSQTSN